MKHYFLVSITIPDNTKYDKWQSWNAFLANPQLPTETGAGIQKLAQNVWLIERASGALFFSHLVSLADGYGLNPQVRFLLEEETAAS